MSGYEYDDDYDISPEPVGPEPEDCSWCKGRGWQPDAGYAPNWPDDVCHACHGTGVEGAR